ncbi:MAG: nitrate reductase molybdenum cofactor assembly chaperone [Gammaproteobacteria bacterium]
MTRVFKALSLLLTYPDRELVAAAPALRDVIRSEELLSSRIEAGLFELIDQLETRDLYDLQERYVFLFDRTRSLSLHLFEHVHGESRDRGQAMVDLAALYRRNGLEISANELPDYLPLFLEFLSTLPSAEAHPLLSQPLHIVTALRERLERRDSIYRWVLRAVETLADAESDADGLREVRSAPDDNPEDLVALDKAWEDEPVTFGPSSGGDSCNQVAGMLRRLGAKLDRPRPPQSPTTATGRGAR